MDRGAASYSPWGHKVISGTELGAVPGVVPSHWIIIMTFLLSLFLGVAKRRDDLLLAESGVSVRKSISGYSLEFVTCNGTQYASLRTGRYGSYGRRLLEETTVAGRAGQMGDRKSVV